MPQRRGYINKQKMKPLNFEDIKKDTLNNLRAIYDSNKEKKQHYVVSNGVEVFMVRKFTYANKVVLRTCYLHILMKLADGRKYYHREQKDGSFSIERIW